MPASKLRGIDPWTRSKAWLAKRRRQKFTHAFTAFVMLAASLVAFTLPNSASAAAPQASGATFDLTGRVITVTMNTAMNAKTALPSNFLVKTGTTAANTTASLPVAVTNVAVDSVTTTKLILTLERPVEAGMTTSVLYTPPTSDTSPNNNAIQDTLGIDAATFTIASVTNTATTVNKTPKLAAGSSLGAAGSVITLTYSVSMSATVAAPSDFVLKSDGVQLQISNVARGATLTQILLTTSERITPGKVLTLDYNPPTYDAGPSNAALQESTSGYDAAPIAGLSITNSSGIPQLSTVTVPALSASGLVLTLTMTGTLLTTANGIPSETAFTVKQNGNTIPVKAGGVAVTATTVTLTLSAPIDRAPIPVTVSYTPPTATTDGTTNLALQSATGGYDAFAFTDVSATNGSLIPYLTTGNAVLATASSIELNYLDNLSATTAPASAFTVTADGVSIAVTATAAVAATKKVTLTLGTTVPKNAVVKVSYLAPAYDVATTNLAIQNTAGADAFSFTDTVVTNNSAAPVLNSAVVGSTGLSLVLTYDSTLVTTAGAIPTASMYTVKSGATTYTVSSLAVSGSTVTLTLTGSAITQNLPVTVSYAAPVAVTAATNAAVQNSTTGVDAPKLIDFATTNNSSIDVTPPTFVSGYVDTTGGFVYLTFNENLGTAPLGSAFKLYVNGTLFTSQTNSMIAAGTTVTGNTVKLDLAVASGWNPIYSGQAVTFTYTAPASNSATNNQAIQDTTGNDSASIASTSITNNSTKDGTRPTLSSSEVSADGKKIYLHYSEPLYTSLPAANSAFSVVASGTTATLATTGGVVMSGSDVILTLATKVISIGETVTVAYTISAATTAATNNYATQDLVGWDALSFTATAVTNNSTVDILAPTIATVIVNSAGDQITLTYGEALNSTTALPTAFSILSGTRTLTASAATVSGNSVVLTVNGFVGVGEVVKVTYTAPASNTANTNSAIQDTAGNDAATLTSQTAINNSTADVTSPTISSVIVGTTGNEITLTYSEALNTTTALPAAFSVLSGTRTLTASAATVSGNTVVLTLNGLVGVGDVVKVSYTAPSPSALNTNSAIQDITGNDAATLTSQTTVNNSTADVTAPVKSTISVDSTGTVLTVTYNEALSSITADLSAFGLKVNGAAVPLNSVTVSGSTLVFSISTAVERVDTLLFSYQPPVSDSSASNMAVQDATGNDSASLTDSAVTNSSTIDTQAPIVGTATVDTTGLKLVLTYNEALNALTAAPGNFVVNVSGAPMAVSSVTVVGSTVELTMVSKIEKSRVVTVDYVAPASDATSTNSAIQDSQGLDAISFSAKAVTNNSTADITPPTYVSAVVPTTGTTLVLTYNEALLLTAGVKPTAGMFTVMNGTTAVSVTAVAVAGSTITLTLGSTIQWNYPSVTVAYAAPAIDSTVANVALQDLAGNDAISLATTQVTNNSTQGPPKITAAVINAAGTSATLTFSKQINSYSTAGLVFTVDGVEITPTGYAMMSGLTWTVNFGTIITAGRVVTLAFTPGTLLDATGQSVPAFTNMPVTNNSTQIADSRAPVFTGATVDTTGKVLTLAYDEAILTSATAGLGAFSVKVGGVTKTVSSAVLSGTNVVLTLAAPIGAGEVPTVSYTAPAVSNGWTNAAIQDAAGNDSVSLTNVAVTNNSTAVPDVTAPTLSTAVLDSTGKILTLTYDEALSATGAGVNSFIVKEDGVSRLIVSSVITGDKVVLTLAAAMEALKPITVSYTAPTPDAAQTNAAIQDPTGNDAVALTDHVVTNNSIIGPDVVPPAAQSLTVSGTQVTITYGEQLSSTTAPLSAYTVFVGGDQVTPTAFSVSGTRILLTLPNSVLSTDRVSVIYTAPPATRDTTNLAVQDIAGNDAVSYNLDNQTGTNTWGFSTQGSACSFQGGTYTDSARSKLLPNGITYTVAVTGSMLCIDSVAESLSQRGGQASDFTSVGLVTEPGVRLWTSNNGCLANVLCENRGTLTISFSKPMTNPIISFAGLGGRANGISWSELELLTPGVTITGLSGTNLNITNGGTYIGPFPGQSPDVSCHGTPYPAVCGSLQINGTVTSVSFKVNQANSGAGGGDAGNEDAWNLTASVSEDFGLAPNVYEQGSVASHAISALKMGSVVTADQTATLYANTNADAVALGSAIPDGADDGVTSWPSISTGNIGQTITVPVSLQGVEQGAYLCGWIDFNRNNSFNAGERACAPSPQAGATTANIVWTVPNDVEPGLTYARLRLSYDALIFPTSKVGSGEVEDYSLVIAASAETLPTLVNDTSIKGQDVNQTISPLVNDQFDPDFPVSTSSLKLCGISPLQTAPNCNLTTLTVADQGTYTVNADGTVTFDPLPAFTGNATPVKYQVSDTQTTPVTKSATISPVVIPVPVAATDAITTAQDKSQSYAPLLNDTHATGYDLVKSTLKLCDISPAQSPPTCSATTITVDGVGTYTLNQTTGVVEFDPVASYVGTASPITYQVADVLGQVTSSTITPTIIAKPTAAPNTQIGPQGVEQSLNAIAGDSAASGYQLVPATLKLCGPGQTAPNCSETIITISGEGNYVANPNGTVSFFPIPGFTGYATPVHYTVEDNLAQIASSTLTPRVIPAPDAEDNRSVGVQGATQTITPLGNDITASGYPLSATSVKLCGPGQVGVACDQTTLTVANEGTYTVNTDGTVSFAPVSTFTGTATPVTYTATDSLLQVASATITPVVVDAVDDTSSGAYDTNQVISPFTNDIIEPGHPLGSLTLCGNNPTQTPNNCDQTTVTTADGTYTVNVDGTVTFNPLPEFSGTVTEPVRYQAADDLGNIVNALITPTVAAPNATAPQNDTSSGAYDTNQTISPLANDNPTASFVNNTLKLCGPTQTPNSCDKTSLTVDGEGTYTVNTDGTVTFNPLPTFSGTATPVTYQIRDVLLRTVSATITPTVGLPALPTADPDVSSGNYDVNQVISPISNDDPGATTAPFVASTLMLCALDDPATINIDELLSCTLSELVIPDEGTYTVNLGNDGQPDGTVTFNPLPTFDGTASPIEYAVKDIFDRSVISTITPTVIAPPLPTATSETITSNFNEAQTYTPTANDTPGVLSGNTATIDPLSIKLCGPSETSPNCNQTSLTVANQGVYTVNADGSVTFTPDANFYGTATPVSYQAVDILGRPLSSTINPIVRNPAPPVATPETLSVLPGTSVSFNNVIGTTPLATGTGLQLGATQGPCFVDGLTCVTTLTISGEGTWTMDQATGIATFAAVSGLQPGTKTAVTYRVTDLAGQNATSTLTPVVPPVPQASNDAQTASYDTNQTYIPSENDNAGSSSAPLVANSIKLCALTDDVDTANIDESQLCGLTSVTVPGEGTYTVNPTTGDVVFNPNASFTGTVASPIRYSIADSLGQLAFATITPTVTDPAISATAERVSVLPGGTASFTTITGANGLATGADLQTTGADKTCLFTPNTTTCDADGVVTIAGEGTFTLNAATGVVTFVAVPGITDGTKTAVTYQVTDITGQSTTSTLTPVVPLRPNFANDTNTDAFDTTQVIDVFGNDQVGDPSAQLVHSSIKLCALDDPATAGDQSQTPPTCTATTITVPNEGTYTVDPATGEVSFDPLPTFVGTVQTAITYVAADTVGQTDFATITPTVQYPAAPTANPDTTSGFKGAVQRIDLLADDSAAPNVDMLTTSVKLCAAGTSSTASPSPSATAVALQECSSTSLTEANVGTYSVTNGVITFTPEANYVGTPPALTYTVKDEFGQVATSTYTPTVLAPPTATNDTPAAGAYGVTQVIPVLSNDTVSPDTNAAFDTTTVLLCNPATAPPETAPNCTLTSLTTADGTYAVDTSTGVVAFTPRLDFTGVVTVPVRYQVTDVDGQVASAVLTPSVTAPALPTAEPDTSIGPFNAAQSFDVVLNDISYTGTAIQDTTIKLWDPTANSGSGGWVTTAVTLADGVYSIVNGEIRFMPNNDFVGTAAPVTYQITDSLGRTDDTTYTPTVPSPEGPTASPDTSNGFINVAQTKNLLTNDSASRGDIDLNTASVKLCAPAGSTPTPMPTPSPTGAQVSPDCSATSVTVAGVGTYSVDSSGVMTFTPALNYTGTPAALPYTVKDQFNQVASSTYTPTVKSPPDAVDDTPAVGLNNANQIIDVLANDVKSPSTNAAFVPATVKFCDPNPDGNSGTADGQVAPNCSATTLTTADGVYTVNPTTGVVTFNPDSDFTGVATEPVTYQVKDADNQVVTAVVTPSVLALPVAVNDTSTGAFNQPQTENVMADDSSNTGTALNSNTLKLCVSGTCGTADVVVANQGTYKLDNGQITFTPVLNYSGTADPVTYQVTDSAGQSVTATYTPTVQPPAGPTAVDDSSTGAYNTPQYALAVADDTSLTGTAIQSSTLKLCVNSVCSTSDVVIPGQGTYSIVNGDIKFTPELGFTGAATPVTYEIADSLGRTDTATYTPTVSMPAAPTAVADTSSDWVNKTQTENVIPDDISRTGTAIQASTLKLFDPAANAGAGAYVTTPVTLANGTYSIVGGQIQFVPTTNFVGAAAPVTYQVADSLGQTATTTYTPTVIAPPVANNDTPAKGANDVNQIIDVIANDTKSPATNAAFDPTTVKLCDPNPDGNAGTADGQVPPNCNASTITTVDGTYTVNPTTGVVTFNPVSSLASTVAVPVTYQVADVDGQIVSAVITPSVAGLPVANNDTSTGAFNQPQSQSILGNDNSNTGTALSASTIKLLDPSTSQYGTTAVTIANQGTYTISGSSIVFTPVNGYAGTPTPVTYQVTDSLNQSVTATYTPTIAPPAPPVANPDTSTGAFNQPQSKNVVANDTSNTGTPVAASTVKLCVSGTCSSADVTVPGEGTYSIKPDGSIEFTPVAGFTGPATGVTYEITDSVGQTDTSTYTPTVALPAPPTAVNDTSSGFINVAQTKNLLTNDSAAAGDALNVASVKLCDVSASTPETAPNCTATSVTVSGVGTYAVNSSGVVTFTPALNYVGTPAALPYIVKDTYNQVATATYTPTIEAPPVATNDVPAQGANDVNQVINLLTNDTKSPSTNAAFDPTTVKLCASNETAPNCSQTTLTTADGVYTVDPTTGVVTFNPDSDLVGTVTEPVRYQVADVQGQVVSAVVTPSVAGLPVAVNDTSTGAFNQPQTENVMADDSSNTGTPLSSSTLKLCVSGTCGTTDVVVANQGTYKLDNGQITFTPVLNYTGTATPVTYQVTDSLGQSVTATYTPTVQPPAGPTAVDDTSTGPYNTAQVANAVADDTSLTGTAIQSSTLKLCVNSVCSTSDVVVQNQGTYSIVNGDIQFTPVLGFTGAATPVTYEIADSLGRTDTAIYTPTVSMPAAPTAVADTSSGWINQTQTENVVPDDVSRTGTAIQSSTIKLFDPATSTYVTTPVTLANGTYSIVGGQIQFVPTTNFVGTAAPVTYQVADSLGQTATTTYTPIVISPPDAIDDTPAVGLHDTNQVIDVLANDVVSPSTSAAFDPTTVKLCNPASNPVQVAPNCTLTSLTTADGTYTVNPTTGVVTFDPVSSLQGNVTVPVSYQVADVQGQIVSAIITPSVVGPPTAVNDTSTGAFNQPQTENVMADDNSFTGTPLSSSTLKLCLSGTCSTADVVVAGQGTYSIVNGQIKFTPELNYTGTATPVTYQVTDSMGQSVTATYTPTVNPPAGPNADPDTSTGAFNAAQSFNVVANDDSLTGTAIQASTIKLFDPAANSGAGAYVTAPVTVPQGEYSIVSGQIQFMPNNDFVGTADPVTYQIADSLGRTDTTTYTPTVPMPAAPNADPDTTSGFIGVPQSINLLTNDEASRVDVDLNVASVKLCDVSASTPEVAPNCTATSVTVTGVGTYAVSNTGVMTFTPEANYTGTPAALPYTVEDQFGQEAASTYTPTVKSPPDAIDDTPPVGLNDTNQTINVLTNDVKSPSTNAAFAPTTVKLCASGQVAPNCNATTLTTADGVYTVNPTTGVVTFNPDSDFTGVATEPVTYQVADVDGQVVAAVITPSVLALPVAVNDTSSGAFNQPQTENVMADDSSNTGTALNSNTLKLCVSGTCGTADVVVANQGTYKLDNGQITFTPVLNYSGTADPVTYQVTDSAGQSVTATYTPTVQPPAGPNADPDTSTGAFNAAQSFNVVANDNSLTGTAIQASTIKLFDPAANSGAGAYVTTPVTVPQGTYSIVSGEIQFMPNNDYVGTAVPVTYQIADSLGRTDTTTYTPTVPMPAGPTAQPDTTSNFINVVQSKDLLANDSASRSDVDLNVASVKLCAAGETAPACTATSVTVSSVGTYAVSSTGVMTFTPALNYTGTPAALPYTVEDQFGQEASSTYTPTVKSPPDAIDDTPAIGLNDVNQVIDVLANDIVSPDTQAPFAPATVKLCDPSTNPAQVAPSCAATSLTTADGIYAVNPTTGVVTFNPDVDFTGVATEPVTYQVADTDGQVVSAVITPSVIGLPVAVNDTSTGAFNQPQTENVMADDSSNTGTPLNSNTLKLRNPSTGTFGTADVTIAGEGTYSIVSGQIKFTPELNYTGTATPVTYQVTDSMGQSVTATYTPTVQPPPGPNADPDTSTGGFNVAQSFDVVANDDSLTGTAIQASTIKLFDPAANSGEGAYVTSPVSVPQGTYSIVSGEIQFMPNDDYVGTADPVTYQIADSLGRTDITTYTPTVPTPAGPNADPDTTSGFIGAVQSINLLTNDEASRVDVDLNVSSVKLCAAGETAPACTATTVTVSGVGTYAVSNTGVMTFTPTPTYTGTPAALPYTVEDQFGQEASSTYIPTVKSPPDALDDTPARGAHDVNQVIAVLANDIKSPSTNAAFDATSVKLCDPTTNPAQVAPLCTATTLTTVDGVYSVDPSTGVVTFDPSSSLNTVVTVPVSYQVSDVDGQVVSAVITPSVVGLPTVAPDTTTGPFNQAQTKAVLVNDTPGAGTAFVTASLKLRDPATSTFGTSPVTINNVGTYSISGSDIVFTPVNGYAGTPTPVTYQITDNYGASASTTYTPTITPPTGPVASPDTSSGALNTAQLKTVVSNDTSSTGTAIAASTVKLFDPTANSGAGAFVTTPVTLDDGVYSIVSGQVQFMPNTDFVGTASPVTYQIADSLGQLATTTYTPTVVMPAGPTASPDTTAGFKGVPQSINLTTNDSAASGVTLNVASVKLCTGSETTPNCTATTVTVANVGTYVAASTGVITFTPTANFTGTPAALPYIVKDQFNQVASSTYTPTVNTPPTAVNDTPSVGLNDVNQTIDVLANDVKSTSTNAAFVPATVKLCASNQVAPNCNATSLTTADGVYTVNPTTGVVTFNPDADFTGVATEPVNYQVADADGQIVSAVITPSVVGLPTASPDTSTGAFNEPQSKTVLINDQSLTGTPLSASTLKLRNPSNGTFGTAPVTIANEGTYSISGSSIVFTPVTNYSGTATPVTYQVTDSMGQSVSTTYTPTVTAPAGLTADPETSVGTKNNPQTVDLLEGDTTSSNAITFVPSSILLTCTVSTNCTVANNVVTVANVGSYALDPQHPGFVIFTPVFNYVGVAPSVTYTVTDTLGRTVSETYSPTVVDGPVVSPDTSRGPADAPQSKNVLENDNVQGANLVPATLQLRHPTTQQLLAEPTVTLAGEGIYTFSGNTITFTPADDFVETILADRTRLVEVYEVDDDGAFVLDDNGDRIVIGLEATVPPIMYQLKDVNGRVVTASYTPRVFFPNPVAAPDYSRGPADAPQRQQVLGNDAATGTRLIPSTLKLIDPATNQAVNSPSVPVAGEGTFRFEGDTITFTPDLDALVETLRLDLVANGNTYQNSRLHAVYENGVYMGLEADITPISYKLQDEFGRWVTTTYYPKVFFPKPAAAPDTSKGLKNQPQSKAIIMNDDPSTGVVFDNTYLKIWDYDTRAWVTSPVVTRDGTYTVEAADGIVLAAGLGGNKQILASTLTASGAYNLIVFTPVNNFVGTAIPIPYQIRDIFGQYVESTYTPSIDSDVVASAAQLVRTGVANFGGFIQGAAAMLLVAAGIIAMRKRRHEEI